MITIDGSMGEGGGQVLRSALGLSLLTQKPFRIENIRANRRQPGLRKQHCAAVRAAAQVGGVALEGVEVGTSRLSFQPEGVFHGNHHFDVGTAGSATLVLQTILMPLLVSPGESRVTIEGGTHNPLAPCFDFIERVFLPLLGRMGVVLEVELERHGFYPRGGGRFRVQLVGGRSWNRVDLLERGEVRSKAARVLLARLPTHIGRRELNVIERHPAWKNTQLVEPDSLGPGNAVMLDVQSDHVVEMFTSCGERGVRAEVVAQRALDEASRYLELGVPVGEHLADQLLIPMAVAGGGSFRTGPLSLHTTTNMDVIRKFLDVEFRVEQHGDVHTVTVEA